MTTLRPDQMPMSFAAQALIWGAKTDFLNPINKGQSCPQVLLEKPFRFVARLIYQFAVGFILGTCGTFYHLAQAAYQLNVSRSCSEEEGKSFLEPLAWEHFKAGLNDLQSIIGVRTPYFAEPSRSVGAYVSSTLVQSPALEVDGKVKAKNPKTHEENAKNMKVGHYRFDELVFRAFYVREADGAYPSLDDDRVHLICFNNSVHGTYGVYGH